MKVNRACQKLLKRFQFLAGFAMVIPLFLLPALAVGPAIVQSTSSPNLFVYTKSVDIPFAAAEAAGNLNVVVVGWNDTSSTIASVVDSNGNTYVLAAGTVSTPLPAPGTFAGGLFRRQFITPKTSTPGRTRLRSPSIRTPRFRVSASWSTAGWTLRTLWTPRREPPAARLLPTAVRSTTNSANDLIFGAGTITTGFTGNGPVLLRNY